MFVKRWRHEDDHRFFTFHFPFRIYHFRMEPEASLQLTAPICLLPDATYLHPTDGRDFHQHILWKF